MSDHFPDMETPSDDEPPAPAARREDPSEALYRRLIEDAAEWDSNGRDDDCLYRGAKLRRVEDARWNRWRAEPETFPPPGPVPLRFLEAARHRSASRTRDAMVALIAGLSVLALVLAGLSVHSRLRLDEQRDRYRAEQLLEASAEALRYDARLARAYAAAAWRLEPSDGAWAALMNAVHSPATGIFQGPHDGSMTQVAFAPDGSVFATGAYDGTVALWDPQTGGSERLEGRLEFEVGSLEFSPDGRFLAASSFDNEILVWDVRTGSATPLKPPNSTDVLAFDPMGTSVAASGTDGVVSVWDLGTFEKTGMFATGAAATGLAFSESGQTVFVAGEREDGLVRGFAVGSGKEVTGFTPVPEGSYTEVLTRRGFTSSDFLVCNTGGCGMTRNAGTDSPYSVPFADASAPAEITMTGDRVVAAHPSGGIGIWEASTGLPTGVLPGVGSFSDVAVTADGARVFAVSGDGLWRWDLDLMGATRTLHGTTAVRALALTSDGDGLVGAGPDGTVVWDLGDTGPPAAEYPDRPGLALAADPTGPLIATGIDFASAKIELWDAETGTTAATLEEAGAPVTSLDFSPDGSMLASGSSNVLHRSHQSGFGVTVWDVASGRPRLRLDWDADLAVYSLDFSPDGGMLATVDQDGFVQVWDAADGELLATPSGAGGEPDRVRFSPDGASLTASHGNGVAIWSLGDLGGAPAVVDHGYSAWNLTFAPGGEFFALYEAFPDPEIEPYVPDSRVAIWDVEHNAIAASLPAYGFAFSEIAVTEDAGTVYFSDGYTVTAFDLGRLRRYPYPIACEQNGDYEPSAETWELFAPGVPFGSVEICP